MGSFNWFPAPGKKPSANDVRKLVKKLEASFDKLEESASAVERKRCEFDEIKQKIPIDADSDLTDAQWKKKDEAQQRELQSHLKSVHRRITRTALFHGVWCLLAFSFVTAVVAIVYLRLHVHYPNRSVNVETGATEMVANLTTLRAELEELSEKKEADRDFTKANDELDALSTGIQKVNTSLCTRELLGKVQSEVGRKTFPSDETFSNLAIWLRCDLQQKTYFWASPNGRWLEIAFWAELGVLVGIVFYIAGQLGERQFAATDIPMFIAEVLIAPPVVLVIFFLFEFSGITAVAPNTASIVGSIGLAFLLGFAIRRTLRLLGSIKDRILP